MTPRYLLVASQGEPAETELLDRLERETGLRRRLVRRGLVVMTNSHCSFLKLGDRGLALGTLFRRHGPARPLQQEDQQELSGASAGGGKGILARFWGGYVAALDANRTTRILRDPSGVLPCYFARRGRTVALASHVDLLSRAGFVCPQIDWEGLARHLFSAGVPLSGTSLSGVRELLPGFALEAGSDEQLPCWSPWHHVGPSGTDHGVLAERLARTVRQCVAGWCSGRGRLLVSVSGGLDSSIVAACLAEAGAAATCLTIYGQDRSGDERDYARALCDHLKLPLIERPDRLEAVDVTRPLAPHLPRPSGRTQALSYEAAHLEAAEVVGAIAFVTGNGGDSVFGYSQSAAALADRYLAGGTTGELLETLGDTVRQTGCGAIEAARAGLRIARGPRAYRCRVDRLFLDDALVRSLEAAPLSHPWLEAPPGALPGKAAHIASILQVQHCMEPGRSSLLPVLNPLMSQPLIEACLAIPSWQWRRGGRDRSVARRAFAADLPAMVVQRRVKGGPDGFAAFLYDRQRPLIRERLLDGWLSRERIVDRQALEAVLAEDVQVSGEERVRLFELLAAEAWIDSWRGVQREPVGDGSR